MASGVATRSFGALARRWRLARPLSALVQPRVVSAPAAAAFYVLAFQALVRGLWRANAAKNRWRDDRCNEEESFGLSVSFYCAAIAQSA